ncbi:MAG: hypothetical protein AABY08_03250, partial [Candidatus Thermoplasmatota archaeon]
YDLAACARVWTLIAAATAGVALPDPIDPAWREMCRRATGSAPTTVRDRQVPAGGERVADGVKEVVASVKELVFPFHGL